MTDSRHLGITIPDCLAPDFDASWDLVQAKLGTVNTSSKLFSMAWHGVGWRTLTAEQYADRYCAIPRYGSASHEGNFREDQALVDFLFNACSAIDCLVFAAYSLATAINPSSFPLTTAAQLLVSRKLVADRFEAAWPMDRLTNCLMIIRDDAAIRFLFAMRDVVTHRGVLPRTLSVGGTHHGGVTIPSKAKDLPDVWSSDFNIDCASVKDWRDRLRTIFHHAIPGVLSFANKL